MKTLRSGFFVVTGFLSCPCHLPLTLPLILTLTAGTALGAFIAQNVGLVAVVMTVYFVVALGLGFGFMGKNEDASCEVPAPRPASHAPSARQPVTPDNV